MKKNYTLKQLFLAGTFLVLPFFSYSQTDTVFYHTNHFTSQYGSGGAQPSADFMKYATRFTPSIPYPCKLVKLKAWFRNCTNPSQFNWVAFLEPNGTATGPTGAPTYISTGNFTNPAQGGVTDSAYADSVDVTSQNIVLNSGDVYAGVTEHLQTNPFIGIAIDTANNFGTDRAWIYNGSWVKMISWAFIDGEWGITAYFVPVPIAVNELSNIFSSVEVYPQPANSIAAISYELKENSSVSISVYNQIGGKVMANILNNENQSSGNYSIPFSVADLTCGIYFVKIETDFGQVIRKLAVIK